MRLKAILVLVGAIAFAMAPFLSTGFNGFEPDQFPVPQDNPPVQPAGYAFSIWGVIYLWLIVSAAYGVWRSETDPKWDAMRLPLLASLVLGTPWLAVAQADPVWAAVLIWAMLLTALVAVFRAPTLKPWLAAYPVQLYAGWLTAASSVSVALVGAGYGIGPGAEVWAYIGLAIAIAVSAIVLLQRRAPAYAVAVVWALFAIVLRNWGSTDGVAYAALGGIALVAVLALRPRRTS